MVSPAAKVGAFAAVTLQRACHNSFIEWAKGAESRPTYTVSSVIFVAQLFCLAVGWSLAFLHGGEKDLRRCFDRAVVRKFSHIGFIYALGDIFEMESVNYIDSSTYTVLSQSKLVVTALVMWLLDGNGQALVQWSLLLTTSSGLLEYMLVSKKNLGADVVLNSMGVSLALFKVVVSCYVSVLNTKALKRDKHSFAVQFSALKASWAVASLGYMLVKDGLLGDSGLGLFGVWTWRTWVLVLCGFVVKTLFNQYLLKVLDAIWKNISEAVGVLIVYFGRIVFLGGKFDGAVFNAALVVVFACISYSLTKAAPVTATKGIDVGKQLNPSLYPELHLHAALAAEQAAAARWRPPEVSAGA